MTEVTIEQAARCPRCDVVGQLIVSWKALDDSGKPCDVATYECVTEECGWFETRWVVQSDDRGMVYQRNKGTRGHDKTFTPLSPDAIARGRRSAEEVMQKDLRDSRG